MTSDKLLDRHYRRVIAEPLPALGNLPPREAARTVEGREKVIGWLKYLENGEGRRAHRERTPPYDFSWMWRELEHLQPGRVLLSSVADQIRAFYLTFRRITLGEID